MSMMPSRDFGKFFTLVALLCSSFLPLVAQTESGKVSGLVSDSSGAVVVGAEVILHSIERGTDATVTTNRDGIYVFASVHPGQYRISARKRGFKVVDIIGLTVNVQDRVEENFRLDPGSIEESVTVTGGAPLINTEDATVSTVVDRNFAENLPLNGRSFQTLINLTPGVTPVVGGAGPSGQDSGQFSVNGQRPSSNYWMVDGVSANASSSSSFNGNQMAGASGITSVFGGTNSLVPVDDMQEFRIQTSTFAPEFGRTPGAQISIATRSGTNDFHGSAFDYFRNDILDANNWFNGYTNRTPLPKAEERQNDFGGTFGGPILNNRTFFFFSYEGLRLRLPTTVLTTVPDAAARQAAVPAMQPFLNAYPLDPNQPDLGNGIAQFNASYSNPGTLNDYNLRIDHRISDKFIVFGRYNYSPSSTVARAAENQLALSSTLTSAAKAQQLTAGVTASFSAHLVDELRFNYSRTDGSGVWGLDGFGGATPFVPPLPATFIPSNSEFGAQILALSHPEILRGPSVVNVQRQINLVDTLTSQKGSHALKFGIDYRLLNPSQLPPLYGQSGLFLSVPQAEGGTPLVAITLGSNSAAFLFKNLGLFAQDTWRVAPRLTFTYGLRWDVDFSPTTTSGPPFPALANFNHSDLATVTFAPPGTAPFQTRFGNIAPRLGVAYQLSQRPAWERVIRGGFGVFYDLATSEAANIVGNSSYPYIARQVISGSPFPLTGDAAAPPPIIPPSASAPQFSAGFDPNLQSPYTLQWNVAVEQGLGSQQSLSASYVGAAGRRLLQTGALLPTAPGQLNPEFAQLLFVINGATSDYDALQLQFQRRMSRGLQLLASHTWSHSIDTASSGSGALHSDLATPFGSLASRGSSNFDIRQSFTTALTYSMPSFGERGLLRQVTGGWSLQSAVQAHTAPPVDISDNALLQNATGLFTQVRPDVISGIPLYLYGPQYPGGKAFNNTPGAVIGGCPDGSVSVGPFCPPPVDSNGFPVRQGDLGRNRLRGFGLVQWDLGVHREFPISESIKLQFRAELFNVLNHPNFAPPQADIGAPDFGLSSQMLSQYLGGTSVGAGGLSPIYQVGGPRSVQLALKLTF